MRLSSPTPDPPVPLLSLILRWTPGLTVATCCIPIIPQASMPREQWSQLHSVKFGHPHYHEKQSARQALRDRRWSLLPFSTLLVLAFLVLAKIGTNVRRDAQALLSGQPLRQDPSRQSYHDLVILLDVDTRTLPLFLNLLLNLRRFMSLSSIVEHVTVLCLDEDACSAVHQLGMKTAFHGVSAYVREGWMIAEQLAGVVGTNEFKRHKEIFGADQPLTNEQLAREMALLQLLGDGKAVLRTDSDVCFLVDPLAYVEKSDADIVTSVQPLSSSHEHGLWSYNWSCPNGTAHQLDLTLNNGIAFIDGRKSLVRRLYGLSVGVGIKLLDLSLNGWAQASFNTILKHSGLCLRSQGGKAPILVGATQQGVRVASLDVLSPCEISHGRLASQRKGEAIIAHANCLGSDFIQKARWLAEQGCWQLPENWSHLLRSGRVDELLGSSQDAGR